MHTAEDLRSKALEIELEGVDFLNAHGEYCEDYETVQVVIFTFIDGEKIELDPLDLDEIEDIKFKLRPMENH